MSFEPKAISVFILAMCAGLTALGVLGFFLLRGFDVHVVVGALLSLLLVGVILIAAGLRSLLGK
jgi:hypothetical protein